MISMWNLLRTQSLGPFHPPRLLLAPCFQATQYILKTTNEVQNHIAANLSECSFLHLLLLIRSKIFILDKEPYYVLMQDAYLIFKRFFEGLNSKTMHLHELLYKMKYSLTSKLYELRRKIYDLSWSTVEMTKKDIILYWKSEKSDKYKKSIYLKYCY